MNRKPVNLELFSPTFRDFVGPHRLYVSPPRGNSADTDLETPAAPPAAALRARCKGQSCGPPPGRRHEASATGEDVGTG